MIALRPRPTCYDRHAAAVLCIYALLSVWDTNGVVIVHDAAALNELVRILTVRPTGKYNVSNRIDRSAGTSH